MINRRTLALATILFILFTSVVPVHADTPAPMSRDKLIEEIKAYADRHVKGGSPMQTQLVVDLYRNNTVGLDPTEIAQIYEEEYNKLKEVYKPSPWEMLQPNIGWIVAAILFLLLIFRDILKEWITNLSKSVGNRIYNKLAGNRFFLTIALRRYQKAFIDNYQKLVITFRPDRPLDMHKIFVPLKVASSIGDEQIDANQVITNYSKLMVLGPPGSGKSMLLKHIALEYAEGHFVDLPDKPIPILLELHRLNDSTLSLDRHLVDELARNDFPNAERFVIQSLKQGTLMLLLDGLDEVNSSERERVVQQIRDILDEHRKCRFIITCRLAIYKGEFSETVDKTLEIVEFNDQQIRSFLSSWAPSMPPDKSTDQLMQTLQDRPRIMALARNPLLLTIIAYLYTDSTAYVLPHSRAEFYDQSTDILLRQWKQDRNRFEARDKRKVLEHLALFFQDSAIQKQQDRRSLDYQTVIYQVRKVLPSLNLSSEQDARPLLAEIVERSGLLLSIDKGERYQFAHLTLQEFFSASELIDKADDLFARFQADHDAWRETVRLWCGLAGDSTGLIRKVYAVDPITAFECLSDAQKVDRQLCEEILNAFKIRLVVDSEVDSIIHAFGNVASDLRPRGAAVFKFLKETLVEAEELSRRTVAANAISLTNLPQASKLLASFYNIPEVHVPLMRMGDLAAPELESLAQGGSQEALDDLYAIGTPKAAKALVPFLWDSRLKEKTAWLLAALLPKPDVEAALGKYELSEEQRRGDWMDWIWQPFGKPHDSALPIIAGRMAYLLDHSTIETAPKTQVALDPRLVIPLCSIQHPYEIIKIRTSILFGELRPHQEPEKMRQFIEKSLNKITNPSILYLWNSLNPTLIVDLLFRISRGPTPTHDDWVNIFHRKKYDFKTSWHFRTILIFAAIVSITGISKILTIILSSQALLNWDNILLSATVITFVAFLVFSKIEKLELEPINFLVIALGPIFCLMIILGNFFKSIREFLDKKLDIRPGPNSWVDVLVLLLISIFPPGIIYFSILMLLSIFQLQYVILFWLTLIGACILLYIVGHRRERKSKNPLQGIFDSRVALFQPRI